MPSARYNMDPKIAKSGPAYNVAEEITSASGYRILVRSLHRDSAL